MKRALIGLAALAVLFAGAGLSAQTPAAPQTQPQGMVIQRVLLRVNGDIVTQTDLERRQIDELQGRNKVVQKREDLTNDAALRTILAEITPDLLSDAIDELLLVQRAHELGYKMSDEQFQKILDQIKKDNHLDDVGFKAALAKDGRSMEQLRAGIENKYLVQAVQQQEIMAHVVMTDEESRQYYKAHPSEFMKPSTAMLREILVLAPAPSTAATSNSASTIKFSAAADDAAREKITALRDRAVKGEDFAKLVTEGSESASKSSGGLVGPVNVEELAPAMASLKAGEISEIVRTTRGYQIFKMESRSGEELQPFEDVREQVSQKISDQRLDGETKKYLKNLRAQALIEWKDDNLKKLYEKHMADAKAAGGLPPAP